MRLLNGAHALLLRYVMTLVANRHDAEDVLQRASVVMWRRFVLAQLPGVTGGADGVFRDRKRREGYGCTSFLGTVGDTATCWETCGVTA